MKIYTKFPYHSKWLDGEFTNNYEEADIILICGEGTIDPSFYNQRNYGDLNFNPLKDSEDLELFKKSRKDGKFIIGIGSGAHLVTVANGGTIFQFITDHYHNHRILYDNEIFIVESSHGQMMAPFDVYNKQVLARCLGRVSTYYFKNGAEGNCEVPYEPEIVWYPSTRSIAIQPLVHNMIKSKFANKLNKNIHELFENSIKASKPQTPEKFTISEEELANALREPVNFFNPFTETNQ